MNWREGLATEFHQGVSHYLAEDSPLLRLAVIDISSVITDAYRQYLVLEKRLVVPPNVSLLSLVDEHGEVLGLNRDTSAHLKALNKLRNHVVHQHVTPERQAVRLQIDVIARCLNALGIDTAEALSALDSEARTTSRVPRWRIEEFLRESAEQNTFARLAQIRAALGDKGQFSTFVWAAFTKARREKLLELRLQRIEFLEAFLDVSFLRESHAERKEAFEAVSVASLMPYEEIVELVDLLDDQRAFSEVVKGLVDAEKAALLTDRLAYGEQEESYDEDDKGR